MFRGTTKRRAAPAVVTHGEDRCVRNTPSPIPLLLWRSDRLSAQRDSTYQGIKEMECPERGASPAATAVAVVMGLQKTVLKMMERALGWIGRFQTKSRIRPGQRSVCGALLSLPALAMGVN